MTGVIIKGAVVKQHPPKSLNKKSTRDEIFKYYLYEWEHYLSDEQKLSIFEKMIDGHKYNLSNTFGSFHWRESKGGSEEIAVNGDGSMDCGPYGASTRTVAKRLGLRHSDANKVMLCTKLIKNKDFAEWNLIKEYDHWFREYERFEPTYRTFRIWSGYNGGYAGNEFHARIINGMVRVLRLKYNVDEYDRLLKSTAFKPSKYIVEYEVRY